MTQIETRQLIIDDAFKQHFYIVPDYQREYVWTEKEINQLFEDIDEQFGPTEYFIGTVLVSPIENKIEGGKKYFDVIDGQQRLTTIFLALCVLRALFKKAGDSGFSENLIMDNYYDTDGKPVANFKLEPRYENADEVIKKIADTNGSPQAVRANIQSAGIPVYGAVKNILNAYEVIYNFIASRYDGEEAEELRKYWGYLSNRVIFIQISTGVSHALKIFETINERGIGLNPMDLLKNLLFTQVERDEFSELKNEWKKISSQLEKNNEKRPLRFLRYFLMANYEIESRRSDALITEGEIYDWFSKKENVELTNYKEAPFELVRKIARNAERYTDFRNEFGNDSEKNLTMSSIKYMTGGGFSIHYVLLLAAAGLPKSLFDQFIFQLESFLFYYIFTKSPTKDLERSFSVWADEMRGIVDLENPEQQRDMLNQFVKKNFEENMNKKTIDLDNNLKQLGLHTMQKYRIHYVLARLTQHVDIAYFGNKFEGALDSYFGLQIEHILPNKPQPELRSSWEHSHPNLKYDEIKNQLGNLTLLGQPLNIVAGNKFYAEKKPEYAKSKNYLTQSLSGVVNVGKDTSVTRINEKLIAFDEWDAKAIERRQDMLISLIHDIWKITEIK